jgi:small subunit ribosomal protein S9
MIYSTGKRKTSIAKVWLQKKAGEISVNDRNLQSYFPVANLEQKVMLPYSILKIILGERAKDHLNEKSLPQVASIKGNPIPQSFYDYINALSTETIGTILAGLDKVSFKAKVTGGGIKGQAEAIMYSLAKCISQLIPEVSKILKDLGFLTRDSRIVERKKYGLFKARKKEQYSKR